MVNNRAIFMETEAGDTLSRATKSWRKAAQKRSRLGRGRHAEGVRGRPGARQGGKEKGQERAGRNSGKVGRA